MICLYWTHVDILFEGIHLSNLSIWLKLISLIPFLSLSICCPFSIHVLPCLFEPPSVSVQGGGTVCGGHHGDFRHAAGSHVSVSWAEAAEGGVHLSEGHDPPQLQWVLLTQTNRSLHFISSETDELVCSEQQILPVSCSINTAGCFWFLNNPDRFVPLLCCGYWYNNQLLHIWHAWMRKQIWPEQKPN